MHYPSWTPALCATLLISYALASPVFQADHSKVHRQPFTAAQKDGLVALGKSYDKYGWTMPRDMYDAVSERRTVITSNKDSTSAPQQGLTPPPKSHGSGAGHVTATPVSDNSEYLCPVTVGGQTLNLHLDTGSSDLWLFSTALPGKQRGKHIIYDPSKSASHNSIRSTTFNVSYTDADAMVGDVATDTVVIGGVAVAYQAFELPTGVSSATVADLADGIVGLGFQKINSICSIGGTPPAGVPNTCPQGYVPNPRPTWFENAKGVLQSGLFTANLKNGTAGYYNFGSIDRTAAKGDIKYTAIDSSQGYWQFPSKSYKVGNGATQTNNGMDGIADTGTSLLMLDPDVASAYYAQVQGAKQDTSGYTFPCGSKLPDFTVAMGDYMATIPGDLINYAWMSHDVCYGGIQSNGGQRHQVFGDIMFKAHYVVFDYDNMRIGFAPHA